MVLKQSTASWLKDQEHVVENIIYAYGLEEKTEAFLRQWHQKGDPQSLQEGLAACLSIARHLGYQQPEDGERQKLDVLNEPARSRLAAYSYGDVAAADLAAAEGLHVEQLEEELIRSVKYIQTCFGGKST
ncbi:hypothetical protein [Alkalicoccus chagannorensis]|uniref:hypothetical protein n=1 Tax=Alkalicoccus chagannorensis TaxID=427072 RepID=UPI0003FE7C0A|nr:hypothetical protein [Alkalicoccus chagannorensis]